MFTPEFFTNLVERKEDGVKLRQNEVAVKYLHGALPPISHVRRATEGTANRNTDRANLNGRTD